MYRVVKLSNEPLTSFFTAKARPFFSCIAANLFYNQVRDSLHFSPHNLDGSWCSQAWTEKYHQSNFLFLPLGNYFAIKKHFEPLLPIQWVVEVRKDFLFVKWAAIGGLFFLFMSRNAIKWTVKGRYKEPHESSKVQLFAASPSGNGLVRWYIYLLCDRETFSSIDVFTSGDLISSEKQLKE